MANDLDPPLSLDTEKTRNTGGSMHTMIAGTAYLVGFHVMLVYAMWVGWV